MRARGRTSRRFSGLMKILKANVSFISSSSVQTKSPMTEGLMIRGDQEEEGRRDEEKGDDDEDDNGRGESWKRRRRWSLG